MTGYVHTIMPRQTVSFKMASPLRTVGLINADVSTCIAGWLDRQPSMMPMRVVVQRDPAEAPQAFNVQIARMKSMTGPLVQSVLTNSVDMEGDLPDEITALVKLRVDLEGRDALVLEDHFSGALVGGARAPQSLFMPVGLLVNQLNNNSLGAIRIQRIDCSVEVQPGRRTAERENDGGASPRDICQNRAAKCGDLARRGCAIAWLPVRPGLHRSERNGVCKTQARRIDLRLSEHLAQCASGRPDEGTTDFCLPGAGCLSNDVKAGLGSTAFRADTPRIDAKRLFAKTPHDVQSSFDFRRCIHDRCAITSTTSAQHLSAVNDPTRGTWEKF